MERTTADHDADHDTVRIEVDGGDHVVGDLWIPRDAEGTVVFAHGSGSSRHSSRNQQVARALQQRGLATLLMDLLTADEERVDIRTREHRFDIPLLAERVEQAIAWVCDDDRTADLPVGLFGSSTGAAAALVAAADRPDVVGAVVSRGGRPDLAEVALGRVRAPTLLVVGGDDAQVLALNRGVVERFPDDTPVTVEVVPGATHLFSEPGALEQVAELAGAFLVRTL